jgi:hypothetical protein
MPVMRQYHMVWATPAMCMLAAGIHHVGHRRGWSLLAFACIGLVLAGQVALTSDLLKGMGVTLASIAALGLPVVVLLLRLGRNPALLADDRQAAVEAPKSQGRRDAPHDPRPDAVPAHA